MDDKVILIILSVFLPPLAVYLQKGANQDLAINVVLWVLGWIPGTLHSLWLLMK